jgi:2,3-bisphosphoglycerate-dependent phosphoglycerate mutase
MEIVLVRHGETEANAQGRMQGHRDYPLTARGREQARILGDWFVAQRIDWSRVYVSPLERAWQTAEIIVSRSGGPRPEREPALIELTAGALDGLVQEEIVQRFPRFAERHVTEIGDFSEFGGESYEQVQARVRALRQRLEDAHRLLEQRILLVGHGGFNFQLLKSWICEPVPRVCIVRMSNCAATKVRLRERHGVFMGELVWHVPQELMGGAAAP